MTAAALDADLLLVGGGLANGLIAWKLRRERPQLRLLLLEAGPTLGGNHTWSFHHGDLSDDDQRWLGPMVAWQWPGYEVRFPALRRRFEAGYASIVSERFDAVLRHELGGSVRLQAPVAEVGPREVRLDDGRVLRAAAVIDGRGIPPTRHLALGWQKFQGQLLRLQRPHGLTLPILMDATVPQHDGYRFVYSLPVDPLTVLVEDTCYSDDAQLAVDRVRAGVQQYALGQGWAIAEVLREEQGVLPIALDGDPQALWREAGGLARSGLAAALFHPTTGYSLPEAVRLAHCIARLPDLRAEPLFAAVRAHALGRWREQGFYRMLNRMLFRAGLPERRWLVMQRFHGLPEHLVHRFYASHTTPLDKARLLVGKPPVPMLAACRAAFGPALHRAPRGEINA